MMTKIIRLFLILFLLIGTVQSSFAARAYHEKYYQAAWCNANKGQMEEVLLDKTRVDCVVNGYSIEFDFADKWAESIGQSLYYSMILKNKPGVVLIMENGEKDIKHLRRLQIVAEKYGITVWTMTPNDLKFEKVE